MGQLKELYACDVELKGRLITKYNTYGDIYNVLKTCVPDKVEYNNAVEKCVIGVRVDVNSKFISINRHNNNTINNEKYINGSIVPADVPIRETIFWNYDNVVSGYNCNINVAGHKNQSMVNNSEWQVILNWIGKSSDISAQTTLWGRIKAVEEDL
jgi:hypothetical protein